MKKIFLPILLTIFLNSSYPANSEEFIKTQSIPSNDNPEEMLEEGVRMIMNALKLVLKTIPQFEMPEVLENGDIIIRRVKPKKINQDTSKKI